jgi:predicted secreted hydrolase
MPSATSISRGSDVRGARCLAQFVQRAPLPLRLAAARLAAGLDLRITPWLADQQLPLRIVYCEGAVKVDGTLDGQPIGRKGYVELTAYAEGPGELQMR